MQVLQTLEFEEALEPGDPRFVQTQRARGSEQTQRRLARKLGWDPVSDAYFPPADKHVLFFGHIGSGKTTELRQYLKAFEDSGHYYPIEVNVLTLLDTNNLAYSEVLMAMAERLLESVQRDAVPVPDDALRPMEEWFSASATVKEISREFSLEATAGAQADGGIPWLLRLFAHLNGGFRTGATTKQEMREEIRNRYTGLAAFNRLIRDVEAALGNGRRVLFLVDGTDKLRGEDTERFFIYDAEQLLTINTLAVYTAPLHLKYDGRIGGKLDADLILPMVKLYDRDGARCDEGWRAMRDILLRRADRRLFAGEAAITALVENSGGHPRELLHLLRLGCEIADDDTLDEAEARHAVSRLAADYRRWLEPEDYTLLASIDKNPEHEGNDERAQRLLHRLALMEYNDGSWRHSHPVIRTLEGYRRAAAAAP